MSPDLRGVAAGRERGWLILAIVEPDKLLAEKDPIATQLVQEFGMAMPNLRIPKEDAELILAFLGGSAGDPALGKQLFTGTAPVQNGGPPAWAATASPGPPPWAAAPWGPT